MKAYRITRYQPLSFTASGELTTKYPIGVSVDLARFWFEFEIALAAGPWLDGDTNNLSIRTGGRPYRNTDVPEEYADNFQFWTIRFETARRLPQRRLKAFDAFCQALAYRVSGSGLSTSIKTTFTHTLAIM